MFYLCELWNLSPQDVMEIPFSRRKRLVEKKDELERKRKADQDAASSRMRSRSRR